MYTILRYMNTVKEYYSSNKILFRIVIIISFMITMSKKKKIN